MLKDTFCSSPWFHLRKTYDGSYDVCRWANKNSSGINTVAASMMDFYNSSEMRSLRQDLLSGKGSDICAACKYQDSHGKLSGRLRQLLKSGITVEEFEHSALSSPHYEHFKYSVENAGSANYYPVDLQIDLGKMCNSSCIMCNPSASSKLDTEYKKLHQKEPTLFPIYPSTKDWSNDQEKLDKFISELVQIPNLKYLHLLGGETLYNPSFYKICEALVDANLSQDLIVGTTTNGTVYDSRLENIITKFKQFHLGISIDAATPLNDYVRWPSKIDQVKENLNKFVHLRSQFPDLILTARITPNVFTIYEFDELARFLFEINLPAESCNILYKPECLRIELMPDDIRQETVAKLQTLVNDMQLKFSDIYNVRRSDLSYASLANTTLEYLNFVKTFQTPPDVEQHRRDLVLFLKSFEAVHHNNILDYAPRYKDFLRSYGY